MLETTMFLISKAGITVPVFRCSFFASAVAIAMLSNGPAIAADEIAKLGEPRRNVVARARSAQEVGQLLASGNPNASGVFPLMIFPSNSLVVENVFAVLPSPATCKSVFTAYDQRLRAQHGNKIRHGLYCVSVADGKLKSVETIAKSY
jgi:hypothetical protein